MIAILKSERGQGTMEILVAIAGIVIIAVAIVQALPPAVQDVHEHTIDGISKITGGGF